MSFSTPILGLKPTVATIAESPESTEHLWWGTWQAGVGYLLLIYAVIAWGVWQRNRRLKLRNLELERRVEERTQALREANASKSRFIESMNHEIRNPVNGIVGLTRILREKATDQRTRLMLSALESCTDRLQATMSGVLDFNALERGHIELESRDFEVTELVKSAAELGTKTQGRIELPEQFPPPTWCRGDAGKIRMILGNYLSNALKYGAPPRASVALTVKPDAPGHQRIRIEVTSPGAGLTQEEIEQLFTEYYRGVRARQAQIAGTGLGLAMCRRYAEIIGGKVGATSTFNSNTFWLEVALPSTASEARDYDPSGEVILRALAVEDEAYNRLVLGHYLQQLGVGVDWAESAAAAVERANAKSYDVILTDCSVADAQEDEVILRLRREVTTELPPIVVVSANATADIRTKVLAAGAVDFLSKPVSTDRIFRCFHRLGLLTDVAVSITPDQPASSNTFERLLLVGEPAKVIPDFVKRIQNGLTEARTALQDRPSEAAARFHALRSNLLLVNAPRAQQLVRKLESNSRTDVEGSTLVMDDLIKSLEIEIDKIIQSAQALLSSGSTKPV